MAAKREAAETVALTLPAGTKVTVGKEQAAKYETAKAPKKSAPSKSEK